MLLGFKTELKLNNAQRTLLARHAGTARHAWNWGLWLTKNILDHNKANPDEKLKFPSAFDLNKLLVALVKPENPWYYESSKCAPQYALRDLRTAWDRCFKKLSRAPRFKRKGKHDSFELDASRIFPMQDRKIKVPVIGWLRTYERLPQAPVKCVTISRQSDRWFIAFRIEVSPEPIEKTNRCIGVDLGIKQLATLSNGEVFAVPAAYKRIKAKIAKLQYLNRHKVKGSANWRKAMNRIAKLYYRAACIRKDCLHKLTTYLAKAFQVVCIENLNVRGMMANRKLAGAIGMLGWYEIRRQLSYKCPLYGSTVRVIGRFEPSSKLHYKCGWRNENLTLKDRVFYCPVCDEEIDRDLNASKNIERIGLSTSPSRLAESEVPTPGVEASNFQVAAQL